MGWSIGYDTTWRRDIGYGVPAYCDHPECNEEIDRGLSYVCCSQIPYGGDEGCGLYFCGKHKDWKGRCERCAAAALNVFCGECDEEMEEDFDCLLVCPSCNRSTPAPARRELPPPFDARPDHPRWIAWKLNDESWAEWRAENPKKVAEMRGAA